jgi:hypothetical protein
MKLESSKKTAKKFFLFGILGFSTLAQSAEGLPYQLGKKSTLQDHLVHSFQRTYRRMGVSASSLSAFSLSVKLGPRRTREIKIYKVSDSSGCVGRLQDSTEGRSALIECLANFGRQGLTEKLFGGIFAARSSRIKVVPTTLEIQKSVVLLYWIQDLIRQKLLSDGVAAVWFEPGKGFLPIRQKGEFDYEDGDVALVTGKSSISSMISQVTHPQRKFSHAFIVRMDKGQFATIEALLEQGVVSKDRAYFNEENLQVVEVHRWADVANRATIAKNASDVAWNWVKEKRPYDFPMDMADEKELFCSEVVARAYANSSGLPIEKFVPELSRIRSKPVFNFIHRLGVQNEIMPSPGDLAPSPYLTQVAEYRNPHDLSKLWWLMIMGDVLVERLEAGYTLKARNYIALLSELGFTLDSGVDAAREILGADLNLLPQGLNKDSIATMITLQKFLYERAFLHAIDTLKAAGYLAPTDLLQVEPWVLRGHLSYATQESFWPSRVLKQRD